MATMHCEIVSAERELFSGDITKLTAVGTIGGLGIYPGHAPLLTGIQPGPVTLAMEDGRAEDLDEASAKEAEAAAERAQSEHASEMDFSVVAAQLAEARAQQRTIEELRKMRR